MRAADEEDRLSQEVMAAGIGDALAEAGGTRDSVCPRCGHALQWAKIPKTMMFRKAESSLRTLGLQPDFETPQNGSAKKSGQNWSPSSGTRRLGRRPMPWLPGTPRSCWSPKAMGCGPGCVKMVRSASITNTPRTGCQNAPRSFIHREHRRHRRRSRLRRLPLGRNAGPPPAFPSRKCKGTDTDPRSRARRSGACRACACC
jgi:hypothetical protein